MIQEVKVNADQCIGCGNCEQTCSAIFKLTYKVHAEAAGKDFEKHQRKMLAAYYGCPVQAIELQSDDPSLQIVWHPALIVSKTMVADTVMEIQLRTPALEFKAGQYVTVRFKDDVGFFNRAYSIVGLKDGILTLCVTLLKGGRGSSFITNYDVGSQVEITDPKGDFYLRDTPNPKVFVGTGTGLAPLVAMMESCPEVKKTLYFGQRKEKDLFYLDRMAKIPNLDIHTCLDFADDDWTGLRGRVTEHFLNCPLTKNTEIYTCGSDPMMKSLEAVLKKNRHSRDLFFRESFSNINGMNSKVDESGLMQRIWVRHVHVYASLVMSVLFIFFGFSGFLASRPALFNSEMRSTVPENIKMEQNELSGYLKAKLPAGVAVKDFSSKNEAVAVRFEDSSGGQFNVEVSLPGRSYTVVESRPLPADSGDLTALQLAERLAKQYPGKLDSGSVEDGKEQLQFNVESVWADTSVTVDKAQKRYEIHQEKSRWAAALVQLHRGKKSGSLQRVLIDLAGIFMAVATLTGIIMGLQSRNPVMRKTAIVLVLISAVLTALMIFNR
ncbi:MAG: PepSY-associated TM helix domain-containing protein [Kiritimatiellales bacterium]|jgi:CDP-4-dehydro-6-deoxyglucose reductase